jgi:hypothetical protein
MNTRHLAQLRQIALHGRPRGLCLRRCPDCENFLYHSRLQHWCFTCKDWRDIQEPTVICEDAYEDLTATAED